MTRQEAEAAAKQMKVGDNSLMLFPNYTLRRIKRNLYQVNVCDKDGWYSKGWETLDTCLNYVYNRK
jgi:hypothetical protein